MVQKFDGVFQLAFFRLQSDADVLDILVLLNLLRDGFFEAVYLKPPTASWFVRITVFCSAIVIDVIVHCHTAGALLSQTAENNCPYHRVVGFLILSGQFIITLVAELGIQPLIRSFWTETSAITFSTFSIAVTVFPSSTYGGDLSWSVDGACIVAVSAQCARL